MKLLNEDFTMLKYGLNVRLVSKADVDFIFQIRSDKYLTRHIHSFEGTIGEQKIWIDCYKKREREGSEYYFIYEKNGKPFGVNRVYNINNGEGTTGSWICIPGTNPIDTLATCIILYDIIFDTIDLKKVLFDTRKDNSSALKVNRALGGECIYETELDYYFELSPQKYHSVRDRLLKIWHIK